MSEVGDSPNMPVGSQKRPIYVLSYDGVVTGSKELRNYNKSTVSKEYDEYTGELIDYYKKYDKVKANEPFFDGFLAHMAFFNTEQPDSLEKYSLKGINYYPIEYQDDEDKNTGEKSKLKTTSVNYKTPDSNFRTNTNYEGGDHIFLLCPTSEKVFETIDAILAKPNETPLFIHIQGEAIKSPGGTKRHGDNEQCQDTGMTASGGGMFGEAFNLFSGGIEIQKLRKRLTEISAKIYSVKPKCTDAVENQASKNPVTGGDAATGKLEQANQVLPPKYYIQANRDILEFSKEGSDKDINNFLKLNVIRVFQDITDKDNLASLAIIGKLKKNSESIPLMLVGFRIYRSSSIPFPSHTFNFGVLRDKPEFEKPGDTRGNDYGNIKFLKDETNEFYEKSTNGFMDVLKSILVNNEFTKENGGIADGTEEISKSLRAPFNMSLYFFPPETYMDVGVGENNGFNIKGVDIQVSSGGKIKRKKKTFKKKSNLKGRKKHKNNSKKRGKNKSNKRSKKIHKNKY